VHDNRIHISHSIRNCIRSQRLIPSYFIREIAYLDSLSSPLGFFIDFGRIRVECQCCSAVIHFSYSSSYSPHERDTRTSGRFLPETGKSIELRHANRRSFPAPLNPLWIRFSVEGAASCAFGHSDLFHKPERFPRRTILLGVRQIDYQHIGCLSE
jgi:hypothetical protein